MATANIDETSDRSQTQEAPEVPAALAASLTRSALSSTSPVDGTELPAVETTDPAAVAAIFERARVAQAAWAATPIRDRIAVIADVKHRVLSRAQEIAELVRRECGKPLEEGALSEVLPNADLIDYWTISIEEFLDPTTLDLNAALFPGKLGRVLREPRGVIALITPWNFPVSIPLRTLIPALLAGNAVVFKPSEITPRSGALVASLFAGLLPEDVLQIVQGGADVGSALIAGGADLVVFTGSVATGRKIAVACAEHLVPNSLELGGKDAAIVLADCAIERTARGLVWGAFSNAGQSCASIERVYVERAVADPLIARVVALAKEVRLGVDIGPLTTPRQCAIVRSHLDQAVASGAKVLVGGAPEEGSLAFPPTVLQITDENTPLLKDETFGPILPIVVVDNEAQAIERTNASKFGLTTSIWTRRINHAHDLARQVNSGIVTINNHGFTAVIPGAPWTGSGDSGSGVTNGPHALSALTRPRFVLEDRRSSKRELWWYPYTPALRTLVFTLIRARGGAGFFGRIAAFFQLLIALPKRLFGA